MEKSIEIIWKEGFLKSDALVAPKLNDLYNQKSMHLIDKFKRMFKINLNAIVMGSLLFLALSFSIGIPIMGVGFFLILSIIVVVNKRLSRGLAKIDKSESSYHYLRAFNDWVKKQASVNRKMARFYYPLFFLSLTFGFWYANFDGKQLGDELMNKLGLNYPESYLFFGVGIIAVLLAYFGGKIYDFDFKFVYGHVQNKLEEIIADMEELRN